jgi:hypothetical protein
MSFNALDWSRRAWRRLSWRHRQASQGLVEYGLVAATVAVVGLAGANALTVMQRAYGRHRDVRDDGVRHDRRGRADSEG